MEDASRSTLTNASEQVVHALNNISTQFASHPSTVAASGLPLAAMFGFVPGLMMGLYIEEKWIRKKKEFIKLHMAADAKSKKVVSFRITRGNVHDAKKFCPLVRESFRKYNIDKVYADKAHDNRRNFNLLDRLNVQPVIAIRNNASTKGEDLGFLRNLLNYF